MRESPTRCLTVKGLLPTHATRGDWHVCTEPVIPVITASQVLCNLIARVRCGLCGLYDEGRWNLCTVNDISKHACICRQVRNM